MESKIKVYELLEAGGPQLIGFIPAFHHVFYEKVPIGAPAVPLEFGLTNLMWHLDKVSAVYIEAKNTGKVRAVPGFTSVTPNI